MNNIITIDGKQYDVNTLPPSTVRAVELFVQAQNALNQKAMEVEIASAAVTTLNAQMRGALMSAPVYTPPAPALDAAETQEQPE
jgi:hypothetical protein